MELIAITGGPGAGKTAVLEMARRTLCEHVTVLPESAGIIFGGGFPRHQTDMGLRAAQRAIYHVQHEMERLVMDENHHLVALCDRGTLDGLAYWPGDHAEYWADVNSTREAELARYTAVIHLRTPGPEQGYNNANQLRIETPVEAHEIDEKIAHVWRGHPNHFIIESRDSFLEKATHTLNIIRSLLPTECCEGRN